MFRNEIAYAKYLVWASLLHPVGVQRPISHEAIACRHIEEPYKYAFGDICDDCPENSSGATVLKNEPKHR
jgi:hypothetical protein